MSVGRVAEYSSATNVTAPKSTEQIAQKKDTTLAADTNDKFVKSGATFTPAYTKATVTDNRSGTAGSSTMPEAKAAEEAASKKTEETPEQKRKVTENKEVPKFKSVTQAKNDLMKDMVHQMITGQVDDSHKTDAMKELEEILASYSDEEEHDENYWGAEETANRILDFAKELAGDDDSAFDTLRNAFETAFSESERLFGGKGQLPSVSYDTYDRVQKGFDDWAKQIAERQAEASPDAAAKTEAEK